MARKHRAPPGRTGPFLVAFTVTCTYQVPVGRVGADQAVALARERFEITRPEHRRAWLTGGERRTASNCWTPEVAPLSPDPSRPAASHPPRPGAISLIAFASRTNATLAWRELLDDPGPEPTVATLAEILMVTCAGRIHRANRILTSSHWARLDDEPSGPIPPR